MIHSQENQWNLVKADWTETNYEYFYCFIYPSYIIYRVVHYRCERTVCTFSVCLLKSRVCSFCAPKEQFILSASSLNWFKAIMDLYLNSRWENYAQLSHSKLIHKTYDGTNQSRPWFQFNKRNIWAQYRIHYQSRMKLDAVISNDWLVEHEEMVNSKFSFIKLKFIEF